MARGMDGTPKVVDSAMQSQDQIHTSKNSAGLAANSTNQFRTPAVSSYAPPPSPSFYSISKALSPVPPLPLPRFSSAREITIHRRSAKINLSLLKAKRPKNDSGHELGFLQETGIERARAGTASLSIGKLLMNLCHIPLPTPLPSPALMNRPLVVPSVQHTPREQKNHVQISKEIYQTPRLLIPQRVHSPPLVQSIKLGYFSAPTQTSSIATPPAQALEHILSTPPSEVPQLGCFNSPAQRVARTKQDLIPVKEFREDNASSGSEDEEEMMLWESVIMERWLIKRQAEEEAVLETRKESECAGRCVSGLLGM
ncbi:hypothetical protein BC829DRAFT_408080 [Chytridium lagenaria]|nr:hypothetical protein BC829DRAFT_408080 [Chytridium lagenaria]